MTRRALALVFCATAGCGRFEGEVYADETSHGEAKKEVYEAKGRHVREQDEGKSDYLILDASGRMHSVNVADREVMDMDIPSRSDPDDHFTKTGATETIAGHSCTVWHMELSTGQTGEVCVAGDLNLGGQRVDAWFPRLHEKGFPLRGVLRDSDGKVTSEIRVTSIQAKTIDASRFELPKEYKRVDFNDLMRKLRP